MVAQRRRGAARPAGNSSKQLHASRFFPPPPAAPCAARSPYTAKETIGEVEGALGRVRSAAAGDYAAQGAALRAAVRALQQLPLAQARAEGSALAACAPRVLREAERVHVNVSCRHAARAAARPELRGARAAVAAVRADARRLCRQLGALEPCALGALEPGLEPGGVAGRAGVTQSCALLAAAGGDPRHVCASLCYYRAYEPERRLALLRRAAAAAGGTAADAAGWHVELREAPRAPASRARAVPWEAAYVAPGGGVHATEAAALEAMGLGERCSRRRRRSEPAVVAAVAHAGDADDEAASGGDCGGAGCRATADMATPPKQRRASSAAIRRAPPPEPRPKGTSKYFCASPGSMQGALAGSMPPALSLRVADWAAPRSPFGLLEELFNNDPWMLLVCCVLLNQTTRLQVDRVLPALMEHVGSAEAAAAASPDALAPLLAPLGLHNQRAASIVRMAREYLSKPWSDVRELHAVGKYAADAYSIFYLGRWRETSPDDHFLNFYHEWLMEREGDGSLEEGCKPARLL